MLFRKLAPNGHSFLDSREVEDKKAQKIIDKNLPKNKGGWYTFEVRGNEVIVGNNLQNEIKGTL